MKNFMIGTLCIVVGILLYRHPGEMKEEKTSNPPRPMTTEVASPEKEEFVPSDELKKRLENAGLSTKPDEWSGISTKEKE